MLMIVVIHSEFDYITSTITELLKPECLYSYTRSEI